MAKAQGENNTILSRENAIQILDEFLELDYNVDPLNSLVLKAHRLHVGETELFWRLSASEEQYKDEKQGGADAIGGGMYFIDKEKGEIFAVGSSPSIDWEGDFVEYKRGKKTEVEWSALKSRYLECKVDRKNKIKYEEAEIKCLYSEREKAIKEFFERRIEAQQNLVNPRLIVKPFEANTGVLSIGLQGELLKDKVKLIQLPFKGGLNNYTVTLRDIQKWLRVNGEKSSDKYWIEIIERDFKEDFREWRLAVTMELM